MRALHAGVALTLLAGGITLGAITTTSTGCSNVSQVRAIYTALDATGNRPRDTFYPDTTLIYCDVDFSARSNDETVDVQFIQTSGEDPLYQGDGNLHPVSRLWTGIEDAPTEGVTTLAFSMQPPQLVNSDAEPPPPYQGVLPYPVGAWKCVVTVNGEPAGEAAFKVEYPTPDCPASGGAYTGMSCAGTKGGDKCPNDSNFNPTGTDCTCQTADQVPQPYLRIWTCQ